MKELRKTYFSLIMVHIAITLGFALVFGTNHPFSAQYAIDDLYPLITSSATLATILYALGGYLFVVAKENKAKLLSKILVSSVVFTIVLFLIWFLARSLFLNGFQRNVWLMYVIANYPTAIIYNTIINIEDLHSVELVLTIIPPMFGFYIGALIRLLYEPQWRKR